MYDEGIAGRIICPRVIHACMGDDGGTRLTVRLDPELDEQLENERTQGPYNVPKSEVVRTALKDYFADEPKKCPPV